MEILKLLRSKVVAAAKLVASKPRSRRACMTIADHYFMNASRSIKSEEHPERIAKRIAKMKFFSDIDFKVGWPSSSDEGMYAMDTVAWHMDESFSDKPKCVSPVIAAAMRRFYDGLPESKRNEILKPLLLEVIGTNTTLEDEITRAHIASTYAQRFADIAPSDTEAARINADAYVRAAAAATAREAVRVASAVAAVESAVNAVNPYAAAYAAIKVATDTSTVAIYAAEAAAQAAYAVRADTAYVTAANAIYSLSGEMITDMCKVGRCISITKTIGSDPLKVALAKKAQKRTPDDWTVLNNDRIADEIEVGERNQFGECIKHSVAGKLTTASSSSNPEIGIIR